MGLADKLATLRAVDARLQIFGASSHRYRLAPPLLPKELAAAEAQFGVAFPDEYRSFLLEVGAGGAGPGYGVFPLVEVRGTWGWNKDADDLIGDLRAPFPHVAGWNLDGHPLWSQRPADDADLDAWDEWQAAFEAVYWDPRWTAGAICLQHLGCALRSWLVVTGPERGHMWLDEIADQKGLSPIAIGERARVTFAEWYEDWLDASLASLAH